MKRRIIMAGLVVTGLFMSLSANAAFILTLDGMAVYDTDLDITWLQDANAGAGSAFDDGASAIDGLMSWASAIDWAANLTVEGHTDWRLPTIILPEASCSVAGGLGTGCTLSEMAHLANVEGISVASPGLFSNIQPDVYWYGTEVVGDVTRAWIFRFSDNLQGQSLKTTNFWHAWAVHDGNPGGAVIPIPAAVWLFGSALGLLGWIRRKAT